ncbi:fluoride efflux transporter FluC (plasmid) [Coraliomargarita sp. W4R53]
MMPWLFFVGMLGGGIGAVARFVIDGLIMRHVPSGFPLGIFLINTTGSLLLGFLTGLADPSVLGAQVLFVLGQGVMGGYTTFSTAMVDTVHMIQKRTYGRALVNSLAMIVVTVAAAFAGLALARGI